MKVLLPTEPFPPEVLAAIVRLETGDSFEDIATSYEVAARESIRRARPALIAMLVPFCVFAAAFAIVRGVGWLSDEWLWTFVLVVPFVAVFTNVLRGTRAVKEEERLSKALRKWRKQAIALTRKTG